MAKKAVIIQEYDLRTQVPKVLLFGNGISMACGKSSCKSLIENVIETYKVRTHLKAYEEISQFPFTMQVVLASGNDLDHVCKDISADMKDPAFYTNLDYHIVESMLHSDADAYLTTNYSYEAEMSLEPDFIKRRNRYAVFTNGVTPDKNGVRRRESLYQLHSFYRIAGKDIWHIHGEAFAAKSIVLGHYYYGKLIAEYQRKAKDLLSKQKWENTDYIIRPDSWLDFFLFGDVSIIGFRFDLAETDLWWLLDIKSRLKRKHSLSNSVTFYYADDNDISPETKRLLAVYGVNLVRTLSAKEKYAAHYEHSFADIKLSSPQPV